MSLPVDIGSLQALGADKLMKSNKNDLIAAIMNLPQGASVSGGSGQEPSLNELMSTILDQGKARKEEYQTVMNKLSLVEQEVRVLKVENDELKSQVNTLTTIVGSQQRFLERVDANMRARNFIIKNMREANDADDTKLVGTILAELGCKDAEFSCKRLGQKRTDNKARFLLVIMATPESREKVMKSLKRLESSNIPELRDLKIRRDQHPSIAREWGRLYGAFEKAKQENPGVPVDFDKNHRVIRVDGVDKDNWKSYF